MTNDDLSDAIHGHFPEIVAKLQALPPGPSRRRMVRAYRALHHAAVAFHSACVDAGEVQPFGGTDKPDPEE